MAKKWLMISDRQLRSPIPSYWSLWSNDEAKRNCRSWSEVKFLFFTWFPQMNRLVARAQKLKPKLLPTKKKADILAKSQQPIHLGGWFWCQNDCLITYWGINLNFSIPTVNCQLWTDQLMSNIRQGISCQIFIINWAVSKWGISYQMCAVN